MVRNVLHSSIENVPFIRSMGPLKHWVSSSVSNVYNMLFVSCSDTNAELDGLKHQVQNLHKVSRNGYLFSSNSFKSMGCQSLSLFSVLITHGTNAASGMRNFCHSSASKFLYNRGVFFLRTSCMAFWTLGR